MTTESVDQYEQYTYIVAEVEGQEEPAQPTTPTSVAPNPPVSSSSGE